VIWLNRGSKLALVVIICISISGCNQMSELLNPAVPQESDAVVNKDAVMDYGPVRGGTLKLFSTHPDTFNPIATTNIYVREMLSNVYEGLVKLDNHTNPVPVLADSWTVSEDLMTWTFSIKKNVFWHDNIPFTAEDVEYTVDVIKKYGGAGSTYRTNLENIAAYAAVDKNTFRVSLKSPDPFTAEQMTFPVVAKHYYLNENFLTSEKNNKPMGTGPYKFISYEPKQNVKLMMNDKWWGAKGTKKENVDMPYITELQYNLYEVGKDAVNAFQTMDIDVSGMSNMDAAKYKGRQDLYIKKYPNREYNFLSFNLSRTALGVKTVRQSIAYAIDRNTMKKNILGDQATLSYLPITPNSWLIDQTKKFYEYDPDKAKKLLSDDGWRQTQYGIYKYVNGNYAQLTFELLVNNENDTRVRVAQFIAERLAEVGINVTLKKVDFNTYQNLLASKSYDMALVGYKVPVTADLSYLYATWNNRVRGNTCYNMSGFSNAQMDSLLGNANATRGTLEDSIKLKQIYNDMSNIAMEELPYLGLYYNNDSMIFSKRIRGEINPSVTDRFSNINRWYLP